MGILHAVYGENILFASLVVISRTPSPEGVGALVAPLSATQFANMSRWSFQYLISLGIAFLNTVVLIAVFRGKRQEGKNYMTSSLVSDFEC